MSDLGRCAGFDPMERQIGHAGQPQTRLSLALAASRRARDRVVRMKLAAGGEPATGGFPYPGRTLAEVRRDQSRATAEHNRARTRRPGFWAEPLE